MSQPTSTNKPVSRNASALKSSVLVIMAFLILVPSMLGFGAKFLEFIHTFQGEADGAFAITPMLNYLLASAGFFFMLVWAAMKGMFSDIEQPKHDMLEFEAELNKRDQIDV